MAVAFHESGRARAILAELRAVVAAGLAPDVKALQRSPHLVLLNVEWYHEHMKPVRAQWRRGRGWGRVAALPSPSPPPSHPNQVMAQWRRGRVWGRANSPPLTPTLQP